MPSHHRRALGVDLLSRVRRDPRNATLVWALGRTGARVPLYGPLNTVVDPDTAGQWARSLLQVLPVSPEVTASIVQIAGRTGDPALDVDDDIRREAHDALIASGVSPDAVVRLVEVLPPSESERVRAFGESLPEGLRLIDAAAEG